MLYAHRRPPARWFLTAALAVGFAASGSAARASFVSFNPTGNASDPSQTIGGIDLGPGNALARNALPLTVGSTFQLYYQATLSGLMNTKGITVSPTGLGTSYQITALASITEVVTSADAARGSATFALAANQASNSFFELYYNPSVVANNLAGTGFNAGTLILAATPSVTLPSVGIFSLTPNAQPQALDQYVSNHYKSVQTVVGSGSALITSDVTYLNPAFFKSPLNQISFNSSLVTGFAQTSPSAMFLDHTGSGDPDIAPSLGTINGFNGKDFQFQADASASFGNVTPSITTPEPASLLMVGLGALGVFGMAGRDRRRRRRAAGAGPR